MKKKAKNKLLFQVASKCNKNKSSNGLCRFLVVVNSQCDVNKAALL